MCPGVGVARTSHAERICFIDMYRRFVCILLSRRPYLASRSVELLMRVSSSDQNFLLFCCHTLTWQFLDGEAHNPEFVDSVCTK